MLVRVLLFVRPAASRRRIERLLSQPGVALVECAGGQEGLWDVLTREDVDLVVVGRSALPDRPEALIGQIRQLPERPEVVVIEDREEPRERAGLLAAGALAVLQPGIPDDVLRETLRTLIQRRLEGAVPELARAAAARPSALSDFVSASPAMQRFLDMARRVVDTDSSLLILGETGVGKERLAQAIHTEGPRSAGPFIPLNCSAIPESLLESELFGHERGAFTGATRARRGYFELAHRGTIFLDEIGEMPLHLQAKLLRVLEDRRIQRVGGEQAIEVDPRVIAATNKDLEAEAVARRFRHDLYYRLAVVTLRLPALRERREDIPDLVQHYLQHLGARLGRHVEGIEPQALDALAEYDWPGNVRELINVIEQVVLLGAEPVVLLSDLPGRIAGRAVVAATSGLPQDGADGALTFRVHELAVKPLRAARADVVDAFERSYLSRLLSRTGGRIGETAALAGINPRSLHTLMRRHRLRKEDFKPR